MIKRANCNIYFYFKRHFDEKNKQNFNPGLFLNTEVSMVLGSSETDFSNVSYRNQSLVPKILWHITKWARGYPLKKTRVQKPWQTVP